MLSSLLAFCWFKQALALVSFSRVSSTCCFSPLFRVSRGQFHALLWENSARLTWVSTRALGKLCCVTSPGVEISEII